ncbi:tyrosine-type recombinase/integrase [Ketobacter sp.]
MREYIGWTDFQVKTHIRKLEEMEYLLVHRGGRGQSFVYELLYNGEGKDGQAFVMGLVDLKNLGYDANKEHEKSHKEPSSSPQSARKDGGSRLPKSQSTQGAQVEITTSTEKNTSEAKKVNGESYGTDTFTPLVAKAANSQHTRTVPVKAFFKWLTKENHILYNPASELELPRLGKRLRKAILTESEMATVLNQTGTSTALGIRDRAILETFYSTGIRRLELIHLSLYDIDLDRGTLMVRQGKGKRDRMLPIGERAVAWVEKYLNEVRPELATAQSEQALFLTNLGTLFHPNRLTALVRNYINATNIGKKGSYHLFRHSMATHMLENGADIRFIQAMLGHANMNTTQIYTQVSIKKLKEVHTLTHPARMKRVNPGWEEGEETAEPSAQAVLSTLEQEGEDWE